MRVNSPAYLYTEGELQKMREIAHFYPIASKYKHMIRNMIKLLALHGVYYEPREGERYGTVINEKRKTKKAEERRKNGFRPRRVRRPAQSYIFVQSPEPMRSMRIGGNVAMAPPTMAPPPTQEHPMQDAIDRMMWARLSEPICAASPPPDQPIQPDEEEFGF